MNGTTARRRIVVTGSSRGIGGAIARDLAGRGFDVVGLSRQGTSAAGTAIACDMADEHQIRAAVAEIARTGPIHGIVNNAGEYSVHESASLGADRFEAILRLNTLGPFLLAREAYPHLKAVGGGLIVNIGSIFEKLGVGGATAYCASKAALAAVTRCLATEWARDGIRVLSVSPGVVETDANRAALTGRAARAWLESRIPVGRAGRPEEIARLVGLLFAEDIPYLTGETLMIDGGHGMQQ